MSDLKEKFEEPHIINRFLIDNVCLPYKLPQTSYSEELEGHLLALILDSLEFVCSNLPLGYFSDRIGSLHKTLYVWKELQSDLNLKENKLNEALLQLVPGDTLALYIRRQNACLMISILSDTGEYAAVVSAFQASAKNEQVMGTSSALSDLFPSSSKLVKTLEIIKSETFSIQLADLCNTEIDLTFSTTNKKGTQNKEIRNVCDPKFVTEWLINAVSDTCPYSKWPEPVVKKIRDDVMWKNSFLPFRRSGMWMCVKAVVNVLLCNFYGQVPGRVLYKIVMCQVIKKICDGSAAFESDLKLQIVQKLAKRLCKLDSFPKDPAYNDLISACTQKCCEAIKVLKTQMKKNMKSICKNTRNHDCNLDTSKINFLDKVHQNIMESDLKRLQSITFLSLQFIETSPKTRFTFTLRSSVPKIENKNTEDMLTSLYDAEYWVRYHLHSVEYITQEFLKEVFVFYNDYTKKAKPFYIGDPSGYSRMVLTALNIIIFFDHITTIKYPMFLDHNIGIDSDFIIYLILPNSDDILYAYKIKQYIDSRNNRPFPSLIDKKNVSETSFSSRHYKIDQEMKNTKREIENKGRESCLAKKKELENLINTYKNLKEASKRLSCEYYINPNTLWNNGMTHSSSCRKCSLDNQANNISIPVFEWPLPTCAYCLENKTTVLQKESYKKVKCEPCKVNTRVVLFELKIPLLISCLRDSLHLLITWVMYKKESTKKISNKQPAKLFYNTFKELKGLWINYLDVDSNKNQKYTTMGSTTKLFTQSHYNSCKVDDTVLITGVIKPNGYSVGLSDLTQCNIEYNINYKYCRNYCTFKTTYIYNSLRNYLKWVDHNENQVISRQNECHKNLKLSEFVKFGSFRAGGNLQMMNLLEAIETRGLSFENESVSSLIYQSLWQIGVLEFSSFRETDNFSYPSFHNDCSNIVFMNQIHNSLETYLGLVAKKWDNHLILLNIIIISTRLMSLSPQKIQYKFIDLVLKCRKLALDWKQTIEHILENSKSFNEKTIKEINEKLFEVCCFGILTYKIDKNYIKILLNTPENVTEWLILMSKIYDFSVLLNIDFNNGSFRKNLVRLVNKCMMDVEAQFVNINERNGKGISDFVKLKWSESNKGSIGDWTKYSSSYFFRSDFRAEDGSNKVLQVGLDGGFFVNGQPIGKLPGHILGHWLFKSYFEDTDLDVHCGEYGIGSFATTKKNIYNGCSASYTFFNVGKDLIIRETAEIDLDKVDKDLLTTDLAEKTKSNNKTFRTESQLIPSSIFMNYLPESFCKDYSHWLIKSENLIEFRPKKLKDQKGKSSYKLDLVSKTIHCSSIPEKYLVDINSETFAEIHNKITKRLELPGHIHIYSIDNKVSIELPRFNLSFNVRGDRVVSNEYRGMIVCKSQRINTFLGLEQGLVLSEREIHQLVPVKRKIIVPHGTIKAKSGERHQIVEIDLEKLRTPPFICFDIDDRLRILRAGESITAWLYLAWLHGITSSALEDPFLKQTGTSRSLQILQSGNCWSCKPISKEDFSTLSKIAELSPRRVYYPEHLKVMQTVTWPEGISSLAAHEGYQHIVKKLFEDSEKMKFAFQTQMQTFKFNLELEINQILSKKAYFRHKRFNHDLKKDFERTIGFEEKVINIYNPPNITIEIQSVRKIMLPGYLPLVNYDLKALLKSESLRGKTDEGYKYNNITNWIARVKDFRNDWIDLYMLSKKKENAIKFTLILSAYAYQQIEIEHLFFLKALNIYRKVFKPINPPEYKNYQSFDTISDPDTIRTILDNSYMQVDTYRHNYMKINFNETQWAFYRRSESEHSKIKDEECAEQKAQILKYWNNYRKRPNSLISNKFNSNCLSLVREIVKTWKKNLILGYFITDITSIFSYEHRKSIKVDFTTPKSINLCCEHIFENFEFLIDIDSNQKKNPQALKNRLKSLNLGNKINSPSQDSQEFPYKIHKDESVKEFMLKELKESWDIYKTISPTQPIPEGLKATLVKYKKYCNAKISEIYKQLNKIYSPSNTLQRALCLSSIWPSKNPNSIISNILNENLVSTVKLNNDIIDLIRYLGILWVNDQRIIRCFTYNSSGESMRTALQREVISTPHENWSPKERPEWLILEIEMDIMIRPIQVKVAEHMMEPPNSTNHVMQLNMGEGKTSVIIPMLVSALADTYKLVRVVVLRPLFNTNFNTLVYKMGGILNKKIYAFPCRRDIEFNKINLETIKALYEECKTKKGIVLTLPEHLLSFHLKGLELCYNGNYELGKPLVDLQSWLEDHSRDVLDESDEILSVKYQLVYSIGKQSAYGEGNLRWEVTQAVLSLSKNYFEYLKEKYGPNEIETYEFPDHPMAYPYFRLLNKTSYKELCELVCTDILKGKSTEICFLELKGSELDTAKTFVLSDEVDDRTRDEVNNLFRENPYGLSIVLILRGLFTYEVFYSSLSKRWRVEYGVRVNGELLQAVPYRAKDVPAERAQFEHSDIMIVLTQLSYYYNGLSDTQLDDVFKFLTSYNSAAQEYETWINYLQPYIKVHPSIKEFSGINLSDLNQKHDILYPVMKRHPIVINFWLNQFLFPKEAKEFNQKFSKSAWDICRTKKHPLTGFSGTKDLKILLPCNTKYFQIPELEYTSGLLISHLLLPENNKYTQLKPDISGKEILKTISEIPELKLLLDVGALMLNLTNQQVAQAWLELRKPPIEAAVYFENNDLVVINRKGKVTSFEISTYRRHLDNCVIYLDDSHTRGTDLKIPRGTIGAVTLGRGVTKDRLMQACMRMRMLGDGHTVHFYSSSEVHNQILKLKTPESSIGSSEVIEWAIDNSSDQIINEFLFWGIQGLSFYRKELARNKFFRDNNYIDYTKFNIENKTVKISEIYYNDRNFEYFKDVIDRKIKANIAWVNSLGFDSDFIHNFKCSSDTILETINTYVGNNKIYAQLHDEEAEVELEVEQEQEEEIERPKAAMPKIPFLDKSVQLFVSKGQFNKSDCFKHLPLGLESSSLYNLVEPQAWSKSLYVTKDFCDTVETSYTGDDYMRPPRWIAAKKTKEETILLFLSGYEASKLKSLFSETVSLIMIMPRSRQDQLKFFSTCKIRMGLRLLEQVSIFSGSQYFQTMAEQRAYNMFIGYCPIPRTGFQQKCFQANMIKKNGYVPFENRKKVFKGVPITHISTFKNDPKGFLIRLTEIRNYSIVSKFSHHLFILTYGQNPLTR